MAKKTLFIEDVISPDNLGVRIAEYFTLWDSLRENKIKEWTEVQEYIFATDTTKTGNAKLPWSNKTTLPKICQIRDNLHANYMASLFSNDNWLSWDPYSREDSTLEKAEAVEGYMKWATDRNKFYSTVSKLVLDYIDYGNIFAMPKWSDETREILANNKSPGSLPVSSATSKVGFVGPEIQRISPLDIVFDPTAESFESTPKIIRSFVNIGELKSLITDNGSLPDDERQAAEDLYKYLMDIRTTINSYHGSVDHKNRIYNVAGFGNFTDYLNSGTAEILTFYGDIYDEATGEIRKDRIIQIVDRHKVISERENPSFFSHMPIYSVGWRLRPDSLWAMGPLDNLVGMQYRIDHLENLKADVFDMIAYPVFKIKGYVEDFEWGPFERIILGDDGDVQMVAPDVQAIQADVQIQMYEQKMEEIAGSPKEAMGFRTPGEKTKYEVQRLENAASRIFQAKITQFERDFLEPLVNAMLELARRNMTSQTIKVFDDEFQIARFQTLTAEDITGVGRIRPMGARHFAEKANMLQNLSTFLNSPLGQDQGLRQHISSLRLAKLLEDLLEIGRYRIFEPYIAIAEQGDAQRFAMAQEEQIQMEMQTPTGMGNDYDPEMEEMLKMEAQFADEENEAAPDVAGPTGPEGRQAP